MCHWLRQCHSISHQLDYSATRNRNGDLGRIVEEHHSKVLVIDLAGITALPSDMLGVLVGLQHRGTKIRLFNVTADVRFILETTKLNQLFDLREGDLSSLIDAATEE